MKELVIFDVDDTIIKGQSQQLFLNFLYDKGHISLFYYIKIMLWFTLYKFGLIRNPQPIMKYAFNFVKNKKATEIECLVNDFFSEVLKKNIYCGALEIIREHQNAGREVILVSNVVDVLIKKIAKYLNISEFLSTKLEITNDVYTGNILGDIMYGESKLKAIRKYIQSKNMSLENSWGYTDHDSDMSLLLNVTHPFAVNPTKKLKKTAVLKNWPILRFKI